MDGYHHPFFYNDVSDSQTSGKSIDLRLSLEGEEYTIKQQHHGDAARCCQ